jgi:hypothetical protein
MAKTEHLWATLARKEGKDNQRQEQRAKTTHHPTLAKHYHQEASWDMFWYHRRERLANYYSRRAKGR